MESQAWDISLNGFLEKKRQNLKIWHWRFMNLQNSVLSSYTDESQTTKTGEFYLHANCKVEVLLQSGEENAFIVYESSDIDDKIDISDAYKVVADVNSSTGGIDKNGITDDSVNIESSTSRESQQKQPPFILRAKDYADLEIWMLSIIQSINGRYREDENFNKFKDIVHVENDNNVNNTEAVDDAVMTDLGVDQLNLLLSTPDDSNGPANDGAEKQEKKKVNFQIFSTPAKLEKVKVESKDPDPLTRFLDRPKSFRNSRRFSFKKGMTTNETSADTVTLVNTFSLPPTSSATPFASWRQHKIELVNNKLTIYESAEVDTLENVTNAMTMAPMVLAKGITAISSKLSTTLTMSAKKAPSADKDVHDSLPVLEISSIKTVRYLDKFSQIVTLPTKYSRQPNTFAILLVDKQACSQEGSDVITDNCTYCSLRLSASSEAIANKWIEALRREIERQIDLDFICVSNTEADIPQTSLLTQTTNMISQPLNLLYSLYNSATFRDRSKSDGGSNDVTKPISIETDSRQRLDSNDLGIGNSELTALLSRNSIRRSIFGVFDSIPASMTTDSDKLLTENFIHPVSEELLSGAEGRAYYCFAVFENQRYDSARGYSSNHLKKDDFAKLTDVSGSVVLPFLFLSHVQLPAAFEWLQENQADGVHHVTNDVDLPCDWIPDQEYDHATSIGNWMYADSFAEFSSGSYIGAHNKESPYLIRRRKWIKFCKIKQ